LGSLAASDSVTRTYNMDRFARFSLASKPKVPSRYSSAHQRQCELHVRGAGRHSLNKVHGGVAHFPTSQGQQGATRGIASTHSARGLRDPLLLGAVVVWSKVAAAVPFDGRWILRCPCGNLRRCWRDDLIPEGKQKLDRVHCRDCWKTESRSVSCAFDDSVPRRANRAEQAHGANHVSHLPRSYSFSSSDSSS